MINNFTLLISGLFLVVLFSKIFIPILIPLFFRIVFIYFLLYFIIAILKKISKKLFGFNINEKIYKKRYHFYYHQNSNYDNCYKENHDSHQMSRQQALDILGLNQQATQQEIKEAYHNLIKKVHPDNGGSNYLTQKINAAKKILLNSQ